MTHSLRTPMKSPWLDAFRITLIALLMAGVSAVVFPPRQAAAQQPTTQLVVIVVRDGAGNPMMGVPILIKIAGDPPQDYDQCVTIEDGTCTLHLLPNDYLIQFVQGWRGRAFIPVEQQLSFGLTVMPTDQVGTSTFVIAERDGQLVPVWDMSRDPSRPPEPFLPSFTDADPLASLDLGPLVTSAPSAPDASATPQTAVDVVGSGTEITPIPGTTAPSPSPAAASPGGGLRMVLIVLIALTFLALVILLVVVIARSGAARGR